MKKGVLISLALAIAWVCVPQNAFPDEMPEVTIATFVFPIGEPLTIASGDFNGDGIDELFIVTEINRSTLTVGPKGLTLVPNPKCEERLFILPFRGNNFGEPSLVDVIPAHDQLMGPHKPIVSDLDGDGKLDVVMLLFLARPSLETGFLEDFRTRLLIYWDQGDCTFIRTELPLALSYLPFLEFELYNHVAVGDFNSDGLLDLAFLDPRNVRLQILYNLGNRTFSDHEYVSVGLEGEGCTPVPLVIRAQKDVIVVAGPCIYSENDFDFFLRMMRRSEEGDWEYSPLFLQKYRVKDVGNAIWDMEIADVNVDGEMDVIFLGPPELADPSIPRIGAKYVGLYLVKGKHYEKISQPEFVAWAVKGTFLFVETGVNGELVVVILPDFENRYDDLWVVSSSGWITSSRSRGGRGLVVDGAVINRSTTRELILLSSQDFESEITLVNVLRGW